MNLKDAIQLANDLMRLHRLPAAWSFWFRDEPDKMEILTLYDQLGRQPEQVFPIGFSARVDVPSDHFASGRLGGFCFPRRPPFLSPFPALNRTLLAERLGQVR